VSRPDDGSISRRLGGPWRIPGVRAGAVTGSVVQALKTWYPYGVIMAWIALDALIGSEVPLLAPFQGRHLLSLLTAATLPLMLVTPLRPAFRRMPALPWLFVYLLWVFLGIGRSPLGLRQFLTLWLVDLCFGAIAVLAIQHATTKARLHGLIDAALAQMTVLAAYGVYGWFAVKHGVYDLHIPHIYRTGSFLRQPLPLAFVLTTMFPLALYRTVTAGRLIARAGGLACMLTMLVATALTFSRGPTISFAIGGLVALWAVPSLARFWFLAGPALLWAIQLATGWWLRLPLAQRFQSRDVTTLNSRTVVWRGLLEHVRPGHVLGEGLGASTALIRRLGLHVARSAHNLFLATLYDHGIIGLLLLVAVFVAVLWCLARPSSSESPDRRFLRAAMLASATNVVITSVLHTELWTQSIGLYVWLILALPFARCWDDEARGARDHETPAAGIGPAVPPRAHEAAGSP
jgi:O-antigen ligase